MISTAPVVPAGTISSDAISLLELRAKHGEGNITPQETKDDVPTFWVPAEKLRAVLSYLKTEIDRPYPLLYDITAIDETGLTVVVHGDNGVRLAGTTYPPGARLHWKSGESIALGRVIGREPECELTLSHHVSG